MPNPTIVHLSASLRHGIRSLRWTPRTKKRCCANIHSPNMCHLVRPCKCHSIATQRCCKCQGECQICQYSMKAHLSIPWVNLSYVRLCVPMQVLVSMSMRQPTLFQCKCPCTFQPVCKYLSKHNVRVSCRASSDHVS